MLVGQLVLDTVPRRIGDLVPVTGDLPSYASDEGCDLPKPRLLCFYGLCCFLSGIWRQALDYDRLSARPPLISVGVPVMVRICLSLAGILVLVLAVSAQEKPKTGFLEKNFKNEDGSSSSYVVFIPKDYDGTKQYPIILFLHGAGETKSTKKGAKMPVEVGIGPAIKKRENDFPFIVVIPQAESIQTKVGGRWGADAPDGKRAIAILDAVMKEYQVDPKRQYLTGLSMGGFGTWSLAAKYPDRWAAIVPICGGGDPQTAEKIKAIPCWCFHGDADTVVPPRFSREMIEALKKAGGTPKYTEYPKVGHNSWDMAYATDELYKWLLEQRQK